jgi:hypothetical protein
MTHPESFLCVAALSHAGWWRCITRAPGTKPAKTDVRAAEGCSRFKANPATPPLLSATYSVDLQNRFVEVKFIGRIMFRDIEAYALDLRTNPRFSPSLSEIVDLRDVEEVELSPKQAMNLAARVDPFSRGSKRAFVAQSQAQINASHMHRILRPEGCNIRVFFSIDDARRWIGV